MSFDPDRDLDLAVAAARRAGKGIRERFGTDFSVDFKSAMQPVTRADLEADRVLREVLLDPRAGYGWIGEESASVAPRQGAPSWVVDPLDGTANFVDGRPEFAVVIGLIVRGTPGLGVVYNPMSDVLYTAVRGGEPRCGAESIRASVLPTRPPTLCCSWTEAEAGRFEPFLDEWRIETVGSTALKMMRVAEGSADLYLSYGTKRIWDVCGGAVIAEAAGATVRDGAGRPLDWGAPEAEIDGLIVVANPSRFPVETIVRKAAK